MVALAEDVADRLRSLYDRHGDVAPDGLGAAAGPGADDDAIAEVIDADGRLRIERGLPVDLRNRKSALNVITHTGIKKKRYGDKRRSKRFS